MASVDPVAVLVERDRAVGAHDLLLAQPAPGLRVEDAVPRHDHLARIARSAARRRLRLVSRNARPRALTGVGIAEVIPALPPPTRLVRAALGHRVHLGSGDPRSALQTAALALLERQLVRAFTATPIAVLARRADASPRVVEADGLRRVPALGTAAAFPAPALTQPPSEE
jgi:hypothetical protein